MNLNKLRNSVDKIDLEILKLLNNRAHLAQKIAKIKASRGLEIFSPERETKVYENVLKSNKGPLSSEAIKAVYREIMSGVLSLDRPLGVAYLGPPATYTHIAAMKKFGSSVDYVYCDNITDVFVEVESNRADYGVVPIENTTEGAVTHTLDMFVESDLKICSEILLEIKHNLLANCKKSQIKKIYSNPQVIGQCRLWLEANLPGVEIVPVSSTTKAAELAKKNKYTAAIASDLAARTYGLKIIAPSIEDSPHNVTRFLIIGKKESISPTKKDKTSVMFSIKDRVGALHDMLVPFKKYRINLTKIESRPSKRKAWDYYFFVDLEGHYREKRIARALGELEKNAKFLKILGSYPVAS